MSKVKWLEYEFTVYEAGGTWNEVPGIYIFAGQNATKQWVPLYIGQASSFKDRLADHDQWNAAARAGATHVHARVVVLQADRDAIEAQLVRSYQPRLNTQLR
jgi:excinuclease UvrABC nuclease subunit